MTAGRMKTDEYMRSSQFKKYHQLIPQFSVLFVMTENYFITETEHFPKDPIRKCDGMSTSTQEVILCAQDVLEKSDMDTKISPQGPQCFYVPVSSQIGLADVMTDDYIFGIDEIATVFCT